MGLGRADLDITREEEVARALDHHRPSVVLNTAAFTGVDAAESQQELAMAVNGHGVGILARACALRGIPMVHLSTDYVFGEGARAPRNRTIPCNLWGRTESPSRLVKRNFWQAESRVRWFECPGSTTWKDAIS